MAFLQPDILPAMAETIHRQLAAARGGRLAEEASQRRRPGRASRGAQGREVLRRHAPRVGRNRSCRDSDGGQVSLPGTRKDARDPGAMRSIVRSKAMAAERDVDLWEKDELGSLVLARSARLGSGACLVPEPRCVAGPVLRMQGARPAQRPSRAAHWRTADLQPRLVASVRSVGLATSASRASFRCYSGAGRSERLSCRTQPTRCELPCHGASPSANGCRWFR